MAQRLTTLFPSLSVFFSLCISLSHSLPPPEFFFITDEEEEGVCLEMSGWQLWKRRYKSRRLRKFSKTARIATCTTSFRRTLGLFGVFFHCQTSHLLTRSLTCDIPALENSPQMFTTYSRQFGANCSFLQY